MTDTTIDNDQAIAAPVEQTPVIQSPRAKMLHRATRHKGLLFGLFVMLTIILIALFAPLIASHDPYSQSLLARMKPPAFLGGSWDHPLGTDALGRDMLAPAHLWCPHLPDDRSDRSHHFCADRFLSGNIGWLFRRPD